MSLNPSVVADVQELLTAYYEILSGICELKAENKRLQDKLDWYEREYAIDEVIQDRDQWKARAEAMEKVVEAAKAVCWYDYSGDDSDVQRDVATLRDALTALDATTRLRANTADVTVQAGSQLTSEVTSAACEEGAE